MAIYSDDDVFGRKSMLLTCISFGVPHMVMYGKGADTPDLLVGIMMVILFLFSISEMYGEYRKLKNLSERLTIYIKRTALFSVFLFVESFFILHNKWIVWPTFGVVAVWVLYGGRLYRQECARGIIECDDS